MDDSDLRIKEIMPFVPSGKDFALALRFFQDLGFAIAWKSDELAILTKDACRFFLQNFHNQDFQDNFMMNIDVANLDDWWKHIEAAGVCWHIAG